MNVLELLHRRCIDHFGGDAEHTILQVLRAFGSFGQIESSPAHAATPGKHAVESANEVPPAMPRGPAHVN